MQALDPFGAAADPDMPTLKLALDPVAMREEFKHGLPRLSGTEGRIHIRKISVLRHKPGRRCVLEYGVKLLLPEKPPQRLSLIGKVRARRFGNESYRLLDAIWNAGFQTESPDGISVPEPLGVIPKAQLWLQRKVPGNTAAQLLSQPDGVSLARHIAEALHKLHRAKIPTERSHTMADELRILHEHLPAVAPLKPELSPRITRLLAACDRLGTSVTTPHLCGIHRDFYPAQVMVDRTRLYLLDFDLYCQGDPGLDVGNFVAHITEECMRNGRPPDALAEVKAALIERFIALSGEAFQPSIDAYDTLTLVRHVYLCTQFPERLPNLEPMLAWCERRLSRWMRD